MVFNKCLSFFFVVVDVKIIVLIFKMDIINVAVISCKGHIFISAVASTELSTHVRKDAQ